MATSASTLPSSFNPPQHTAFHLKLPTQMPLPLPSSKEKKKTMRLIKVSSIKSFSPKRLFRSNKDRISRSRSDPSTFSYGSSSTSSSDFSLHRNHRPSATPTSVLPGDWSSDSNLRPYGSVSKKQLETLVGLLGDRTPTQDEVAMVLKEVGCTTGEDDVSVDALLSRVGCGGCEPDELRETFEFFDEDHDGRITAEELLRAFTMLGDEGCTLEDCRRMIAEVDKNGDGFVCFDDFALMMDLQQHQIR